MLHIALTFRVSETTHESAEEIETYAQYRYPTMSKTQGGFKLTAVEGEFTDSQIIVMLGENGSGKTMFIRMLAGLLNPDTVEGSEVEIPEFHVSYKPQKISPKFPHSVRHLLHSKIRDSYMHPQFVSDVMKPLQIEQLMDQEVVNLSGGELKKPADIYLIDEPSALDSEQRIIASKVIKRFILYAKKTSFVVEHDFIMATYLADRVIVYEGQPGLKNILRLHVKRLNNSEWELVPIPSSVLSIIALNLHSYASGSNPWGKMKPDYMEKKGFVEANVDDGLLEFFGFKQGWHASFVMVELISAKHIAQAAAIRFELRGGAWKKAFMQMDGEPWKQPLKNESSTFVDIERVPFHSVMIHGG
ncbi:ABC transporter E family member 2 [Tanacetum coccineum]